MVGVASSSALGRRWWASAGAGAWTIALDGSPTTQPARVTVSRQATLSHALGETWVPSYRRTAERESLALRLASICRSGGDLSVGNATTARAAALVGFGSSCVALLVAAGLLECFVMQGGGPWDHAATVALVSDDEFDLALSSHLLFLYATQLSGEFHIDAMVELLRVAPEVRVFPLIDLAGGRSIHVAPVLAALRAAGHRTEIVRVPYEFRRDANEMLRITRAAA